MDDKTRDELLLAVADAVAQLGSVINIPASVPMKEIKATWAAFDRLRAANARAQQSDLIRATEESEC